jgi:hypothetical protein
VLSLLTLVYAPWYIKLVSIPLGIYNLRSYLRRDHRLYFISRKEYQKDFMKMETQFKVKSVWYGALTAACLVVMILALIDFMERMV